MAFFRSVSFSEPLPTIEGDTVYLRAPQMSDYGEWATLREASRAFLTPWEPTWPADDLTRGAFRRRLRRYAEDQRTDQSSCSARAITRSPAGSRSPMSAAASRRRAASATGSASRSRGAA